MSFIQVMSCDKLHHSVIQHFLSRDKDDLRQRCFVARHVFCNQLINYLLTGYPVRTEKY